MTDMSEELQYLKGVGPQRAKALEKLGIKKVNDLFFYYPRAWVDRSNIKPISKIIVGERETVKGTVVTAETKKMRNRLTITNVVIQDKTGYITGVWYNQPYMEKTFKHGEEVIFHGKVENYKSMLQMPVPEFEVVDETAGENIHVNRIVPVYPLTENITQKTFRAIIKKVVDDRSSQINEYMPEVIMKKYNLLDFKKAVYNVHFPDDFKTLEEAKRRLKFDEFFFLQMALAIRKKKIKAQNGEIFNITGEFYAKMQALIPFKLTGAQERSLKEIKADFISGKPMNRLVQGDVGSGKTVIAFIAGVIAKDSGAQTAFLAPTEILAGQHFKTAEKFFDKTGVRVCMLTGGAKKKERDELLKDLKEGRIDILIGTHAILEEDVIFKKLGLVIIDEQHRFGVMQRAGLLEKGTRPHTLIMTATPIPRTLSMAVYGDLDTSIIDELPPGRKPIKTMLFGDDKKTFVYNFIEEKLKEDAQIYAVYPLVEESEKIDLKSAIEMEKEWAQRFKNYKTALIHGQMPKEEKEAVMKAYINKEIHILVATTVIEVGIDVPNASVMVIEHAERFGLSQLHQLRGRVGRGDRQSYCVLVGDPKTEDGFKRLNIMTSTNDGFKISEEDLAIRGPGEFMGTRQHGLPEFKIANIIADREILEQSRDAAFAVVGGEIQISVEDKQKMVKTISDIYHNKFDLINVG